MAMTIAAPSDDTESAAIAVAVSSDGTQQAITSTDGDSAVATTSDTGVVIAMDSGPMGDSLENLEPGEEQALVASDGSSVVATAGADGEMEFTDADGEPALKEDGTAYTAEDMAAMVVSFDED